MLINYDINLVIEGAKHNFLEHLDPEIHYANQSIEIHLINVVD